MTSRAIALVTGFGPFPGQPQNASSLLAEALVSAAGGRLPGFEVRAATLPTEWQAGPQALARLLDDLKPAVALHFGVSRRARGFVVETRARNVAGRVCDARGELPDDDCIVAAGPREIGTTLPASLIVERLRRMGLPVQVSRDAGTYLCNAILYTSLTDGFARFEDGLGPRRGFVRRGFIHIPDTLGGGSRRGARPAAVSRLDWNGAVAGGVAILSLLCGVGER